MAIQEKEHLRVKIHRERKEKGVRTLTLMLLRSAKENLGITPENYSCLKEIAELAARDLEGLNLTSGRVSVRKDSTFMTLLLGIEEQWLQATQSTKKGSITRREQRRFRMRRLVTLLGKNRAFHGRLRNLEDLGWFGEYKRSSSQVGEEEARARQLQDYASSESLKEIMRDSESDWCKIPLQNTDTSDSDYLEILENTQFSVSQLDRTAFEKEFNCSATVYHTFSDGILHHLISLPSIPDSPKERARLHHFTRHELAHLLSDLDGRGRLNDIDRGITEALVELVAQVPRLAELKNGELKTVVKKYDLHYASVINLLAELMDQIDESELSCSDLVDIFMDQDWSRFNLVMVKHFGLSGRLKLGFLNSGGVSEREETISTAFFEMYKGQDLRQFLPSLKETQSGNCPDQLMKIEEKGCAISWQFGGKRYYFKQRRDESDWRLAVYRDRRFEQPLTEHDYALFERELRAQALLQSDSGRISWELFTVLLRASRLKLLAHLDRQKY